MKYQLRFFIDDAECCEDDHVFEYKNPSNMLIPRIGEHVWLPPVDDNEDEFFDVRYRVFDVEYGTYNDSNLKIVDVFVTKDKEKEDY